MLGKKVKGLLCAGLIALLSIGMIGCGNSSKETSRAKSGEPTQLNIYMFGNFQNVDKVVKKFEEETKDTLNIKLNIKVNTSADHKEKAPLMLSTGEDIDLIFDAYWMNLANLSSQGVYADLSSYFNNSDYPGLQKAFSKELIEDSKINGKSYAIPIVAAKEDIIGIYLRKDLREKYNIPEIKNDNELEHFFQVIKEKEPDLTAPMASYGTNGFFRFKDDAYDKRHANIFKVEGIPGLEFEVALDKDGKKVEGVTMLGDDPSAFANRPAPYNVDTNYIRYTQTLPHWNQYLPKNSATETYSGVCAAAYGTLNGFAKAQQDAEKLVPGAVMEFYPIVADQREKKEGAIVNNVQVANNFMCLPESSTKKDATMKFLDWLFSSQANHDLFELGIEGEDWQAIGDKEYKPLTPENQYVFAPYELTWNPNYVRINANLPKEVKDIVGYALKDSTYVQNPMSGFVFDTTPVKTEYAALKSVMGKYSSLLLTGIEGPADIKQYHDEAAGVGLESVKAELKKQVQTFLDNKNK